MRQITLSLSLVLALFACNIGLAQERVSLGLGLGSTYNGFGANVSLIDENNHKYLALGCYEVAYSSYAGLGGDCGVAVGWIKSNLLSDNHKHGIGIHLGGTYGSAFIFDEENRTRFYVGLPYVYYFKGMGSPSWTVGATPTLQLDNAEVGLLFNLAYQF